jgi:hypothetical protein
MMLLRVGRRSTGTLQGVRFVRWSILNQIAQGKSRQDKCAYHSLQFVIRYPGMSLRPEPP